MGVTVSVHRCQKEGINYYSIFGISNGKCCCSNSEKSQHHSSCDMHSMNHENHNDTNNEKNHSACKSNKDNKENNSQVKSCSHNTKKSCCENSETNEIKEKSPKHSEINSYNKILNTVIFNKNCCSDKKIFCKLSSTYELIELNKINSENLKSFNINDSFLICNFNDYDRFLIKKIYYPLKKPINEIISFIHFTSIAGDDPDFLTFI